MSTGKIRKSCSLARLYKGPQHPIDESYAELRLIRAACEGDEDAAVALFFEKKLFGNTPCVIDTPYRRFEGLEGVREFVRTWLSTFHADEGKVIPVVQTRANGRSVTELQIDFTVNGEIEQVPMFVVADLRTQDTLDEVRIYCHCSFVPGLQAYRKPLFRISHLEMGDPGLLTGAVRSIMSHSIMYLLGCGQNLLCLTWERDANLEAMSRKIRITSGGNTGRAQGKI